MHKHYHLIGIGGIGMSCIAQLLLRRGVKVSGSDIKETKITGQLKVLGATIFIGHDAANIRGATQVIYSSAIREDNPEFSAARSLGLPLVKRAQALAELMQDKTVITVTGSHGKTTTTSLVSCLLIQAGLMPTVAIGGISKNIDTNACLGEGRFFVAEADESDGSFLYYRPTYSIITNIDREHLDYYKEFKNELDTFKEFLAHTDEEGCAFCCGDDANLRNILKDYKRKVVLFGLNDTCDIYPKNILLKGLSSEFDCLYKGKLISGFKLALGGKHNISNALSVIALGLELGIDLGFIKNALCGYKGAQRRLEVKFQNDSLLLVDDYAHHPTEIKATLAALNNLEYKKVIAVFQPHRYTRTKLLLEEFAGSFNLADSVIITDIYPASEPPIEGVDARLLCSKIKEYAPDKEVIYLPKDQIISYLLKNKNPQELIVTLGAGDIVKISDELAQNLKKQG